MSSCSWALPEGSSGLNMVTEKDTLELAIGEILRGWGGVGESGKAAVDLGSGSPERSRAQRNGTVAR